MESFLIGLVIGLIIGGLVVFFRSKQSRAMWQYVSKVLDSIATGQYDTRLYDSDGTTHATVVASVNNMAQSVEDEVVSLRHERDVLQHILRSMTTGVVYIGANGRVQMVNEAAERMFRRPAEQWLNQEHWTVFRDYNLSAAIDRALLFGTGWQNELKLRENLTAEVELIAMQTTQRLNGSKTAYDILVISNDVSDWHRLELMRSEFVANVSHELKTPISAIRGFAETLLDGDVDPETTTSFLQTMYDEAFRMGNLVSDLLELSKLEGQENAIQPSSIDLGAVIERAETNLQGVAEKHQITLNVTPCGAVTVWADEEKILQVLLNLLTNAIHYTPGGGDITVWCDVLVDRVKVHVVDSGIGIPETDQARVFERFYRVDRDRSRATGGTGLGLAIVKHIVSVHGGQVGVSSEVGKGSDFWFTLPRLEGNMTQNRTSQRMI